ncbi:glycosyltransferase [Robertkochia sediminum]|uniref:glycosyltransferase n=1 Tax=Robertkochia sediminum TaxID=2785326 RepID=UPI0019338223|nr:glycosyltransferase [Robertkochia sediminum]MBL7473999.1 glycosyltransferase [Robertkochia sediminum]
MRKMQRILVAPLNWGLGHATRCIPIIRELKANGFDPVIASDGVALELLKTEFDDLEFVELPGYQVEYAKKPGYFKWKLLLNSPKMMKAVAKERKLVKKLVKDLALDGIISDNRLGVYSKKVPSVFMTHQLNVLSGNTSAISTAIHQRYISKFDVCWVPDTAGEPNLSGVLGHPDRPLHDVRYLGPLSRLEKLELPVKYDLFVLLSGPEPQRTLLEERLLDELQDFAGQVLFVRGKIEARQTVMSKGHMKVYNFMNSEQLEVAFSKSSLALCRSGYTTIMDLAKLEKKAFFIPTPGQYEQEYLAKRLDEQGLVPFAAQDTFKVDMLNRVKDYKGLGGFNLDFDTHGIFDVFASFQSK